MKKFTSLLALFLICFGITASAQTIESIGQNITDPATQLTDGTYVLLKNVEKGYLYVGKNFLLQSNATAPVVGTGTEYIWKVSVREDGMVAFYATDGRLIGRPNFKQPANSLKTVKQMGAWNVVEKYGTTTNWQLHVKWTYNDNPHEFILATNNAGNLVAEKVSNPSANAAFEIIPVVVAKTQDQKDVEAIVTAWTGLEKYAGGIADLKPINACKTKAEAEAAVKAAVKNPIDDTEYFQILNVKSGKALNAINGALSSVEASAFDANQLWKLGKNAEGKYTLLHVNYNQFAQSPGTNALAAAEVVLDVKGMDLAQWSLSTAGTNFLTLNADGTVGSATAATEEGAQWYLVPKKDLKVALTPVYAADGTTVVDAWGSIYLPFDATCGNSAAPFELYGVSAAANGVATLQKLTDLKTQGIKAGKGLIFHAVADADGTFQLEYGFKIGKNAKNATEDQSWNLLSGTNVEKAVEGTEYVLGLKDGKVAGLYAPKAEILKVNKAFFVPTTAAVNGFRFDFGETTGIEAVAPVEEANAVYYDLSGRRVLTPSNGVYIKNGKKVYVK